MLAPVLKAAGLRNACYEGLAAIVPACWASLLWALLFVALMTAIACAMYKKKIFIKL